MTPVREHNSKKIALAFAMVYLFWGSTFLAVSYGVKTIPALFMAGARQVLAGILLYIIARASSKEKPTPRQWLYGAIIGALLVTGGNGSIAWAESRATPTSVTALLVATVPLWMVLVDWSRPRGLRPSWRALLGIAVGLAGVGFLITPNDPLLHTGASAIRPICAAVLAVGSFCWATGSIISRHAELPHSPLLGTAMFTSTGGLLLWLAAIADGETKQLNFHLISSKSMLAVLYLAVFGSIVGFSAYTYLLKRVPPGRVATYAYVNPVVAVLLGWLFAGEALTPRMIGATAIILVAVALVITAPHAPAQDEIGGQPVIPD
jgi:drug/metabolite transporter (DMT)-like permease